MIVGVAGSGKTTVGRMLADAMKCSFFDGDSLHSQENIDKMSHGIALTDADRAPWLAAIHARIVEVFERGQNLVVGCSALKKEYRRHRRIETTACDREADLGGVAPTASAPHEGLWRERPRGRRHADGSSQFKGQARAGREARLVGGECDAGRQ